MEVLRLRRPGICERENAELLPFTLPMLHNIGLFPCVGVQLELTIKYLTFNLTM